VCSDSRLGWLRECFRMLGWAGALMLTSSLAVAQSTPNVQFTDITAQSHIDFTLENSATSNKYLIETMPGGVAVFDYDNDGRLDIFFTNGALISDPMPDGPSQTSPSGPVSLECPRATTAWAWL